MSTTVTYKGETLTTVNNTTKTLETKGTWLEDDIELTDVSGGGSTLITKNISANGTYNASSDSADGYSQVNVAVPASAVDTGTKQITANGNNQDVVGYAAVNVAVPNSYSAGDEGKVVDSGALVAQTAHADVTPTTSDQTIDTTLNNSLKVKGDADLVAGNIKKDVEIFGVTGSYEGGGGGGSGSFEILKTVTISENVNAIKLDYDASWETDYDVIFVVMLDTLTAADYIYYNFNTQSPSMYASSSVSHYINAFNRKINGVWNNTTRKQDGAPSNTTGFPSYLYFKTYVATKYFTTGTVVTVYGGKFS